MKHHALHAVLAITLNACQERVIQPPPWPAGSRTVAFPARAKESGAPYLLVPVSTGLETQEAESDDSITLIINGSRAEMGVSLNTSAEREHYSCERKISGTLVGRELKWCVWTGPDEFSTKSYWVRATGIHPFSSGPFSKLGLAVIASGEEHDVETLRGLAAAIRLAPAEAVTPPH